MMGGDPAMNIIIARVPVLNAPEHVKWTKYCDSGFLVKYSTSLN